MTNIGCMMTGYPIEVDGPIRSDNVIVVMQRGKVIGVLSEEGQEATKTIRMTFTRQGEAERFAPLQGTVVETFRTYQPDDAA